MLPLWPLLLLAQVVLGQFWMEEIAHVGKSPYHPDAAYQVFRNVKDFGAVGDGVTDDTAAINYAISFGGRCEPGVCNSSTISPATVYFPSGTYLISNSIIDLFYTQLIGNPIDRPIIKASPAFTNQSFGLIDANPYQPWGFLGWLSVNTFFRQVRNFVFDTTALPADFNAIGVHWPSAQATSITNCVFRLSTAPGNKHTGLFIEEGSGGLLNDLYFYGGGKAAILGNQQYTARNLWFFGSDIGILMTWDWGWTYKTMHFEDCRVGIAMDADLLAVGSITLIDSWFSRVQTALYTNREVEEIYGTNGTLIMENVLFEDVPVVLAGPNGTILDQTNVQETMGDVFVMGHVANEVGLYAQTGYYASPPRNPSLLVEGKYYERSKPHYDSIPANKFQSARQFGAVGDGLADDAIVLNELLNYTATNGLIAHLDAGVYIVSDTIFIPPGARIVGEALAAIIMGTGAKFQDMSNPRPVVQIGMPGQEGRIEWSDTIVSTRGPCAGAIAIQYNLHSDTGVPSGMWDVHIRIGGFAGTELQLNECAASSAPKGNEVDQNCIAAFMSMHITRDSGMLFTENCWVWVADHDLEDPWVRRVSIFAGRGVLIESERGQIWLSATSSEHHVLYQYQIQGSRAVYLGHTQTESPYYQPQPLARYPFPVVPELNDPDFERDCAADSAPGCESAWAIRVIDSSDIVVYGAGLYSFFDSYSDSCSRETSTTDCQGRLLSIQGNTPGVKFAGLSTVATRVMIHRDQKDFVHAQPNKGTFADTLALYLP